MSSADAAAIVSVTFVALMKPDQPRLRSMTAPEIAWVAGATGLIGRELLALQPARRVHALLRRPQTLPPGVTAHQVDYAALDLSALPAPQHAYCALGTTIKVAGSQAAFRAVDFEAVLAFARAAQTAGATAFGLVSAMGAAADSAVFYNRVKGEVEAALRSLGFHSLVIARPSLLQGDRQALGQPVRPIEHLAQVLARPLRTLLPNRVRPIEAATVARALVRAVQQEQAGVRVLESGDLQELGKA